MKNNILLFISTIAIIIVMLVNLPFFKTKKINYNTSQEQQSISQNKHPNKNIEKNIFSQKRKNTLLLKSSQKKFFISSFSQNNYYKILLIFKQSSPSYNFSTPLQWKILEGKINDQYFTLKIPATFIKNAYQLKIIDTNTKKTQTLSAQFLQEILKLPKNENLQIFIDFENPANFSLSSKKILHILPGPN